MCHSVEKGKTAIKERCFFEGKGTVVTKRNSEKRNNIVFFFEKGTAEIRMLFLQKRNSKTSKTNMIENIHMLLEEQKSNFVEEKGTAKNDKKLFKSNLCTRITQKTKTLCTNCKKKQTLNELQVRKISLPLLRSPDQYLGVAAGRRIPE